MWLKNFGVKNMVPSEFSDILGMTHDTLDKVLLFLKNLERNYF